MEDHLSLLSFAATNKDMHILPSSRNRHVALQRGCAVCMPTWVHVEVAKMEQMLAHCAQQVQTAQTPRARHVL